MNFSHVLISRPDAASRQLAEQVRALDLEPLIMPAFDFHATGARVGADAAWRNARTRLAVFTSPRAVEFGLAAMEPGLLDQAMIAALGPATARALQEAGFNVNLQPPRPFTSESLLAKGGFPASPGAALIFAAPGGRDLLRSVLEQKGWKVRVAMVYERRMLNPGREEARALLSATGVISLWTSGSALEWLLNHLPEQAAQKVRDGLVIVASRRLAALADQLGACRVRVADGPDNESLLAAVRAA